jgi:hypothetical protein
VRGRVSATRLIADSMHAREGESGRATPVDWSRRAELRCDVAIVVDAGQAFRADQLDPGGLPVGAALPGQQRGACVAAAGNVQGAAAGGVA